MAIVAASGSGVSSLLNQSTAIFDDALDIAVDYYENRFPAAFSDVWYGNIECYCFQQ